MENISASAEVADLFSQFAIIVRSQYDAINLITNSLLLLYCCFENIGAIHTTSVIQVTWFAVSAIIAALH